MSILIGTDPELFVRNKITGKYRSGHDLIPGTKIDPYFVNHGAVQVDGVALEFNTFPAETVEEFQMNILAVRSRMTQMALTSLNDPDGKEWEIVATPTALFDQEYFDNLPFEPKLLGCTPDYNAYTEDRNIPPSTDEPFRTGSGHIHVGWTQHEDPYDKAHFKTCCELVKALDAALYPMSHTWDVDDKRRTLYGKKGSFRPKSYGVEYRPLSNAYLADEEIIRTVFRVAKGTAELYFKGIKLNEL